MGQRQTKGTADSVFYINGGGKMDFTSEITHAVTKTDTLCRWVLEWIVHVILNSNNPLQRLHSDQSRMEYSIASFVIWSSWVLGVFEMIQYSTPTNTIIGIVWVEYWFISIPLGHYLEDGSGAKVHRLQYNLTVPVWSCNDVSLNNTQ